MIANRGNHATPFASAPNAGDIVDAIGKAIYAPDPGAEQFFGIPLQEFKGFVYSSDCLLHWGCDEAFDDGSSILHFDVGNRVRLIADKPPRNHSNLLHDPETLRDVWLDADEFYGVLERWKNSFEAEWKAMSKIPKLEDGAE